MSVGRRPPVQEDVHVQEEVHVHLHLDPLRVILEQTRRPGDPVTVVLTIGGSLNMPAQISIDDTSQAAKVYWVDDKGDTDAAAPAGAQVTFSVTDPTVATVDPQDGKLTPVAEGSASVNVSITDASGQPLMEPDGVTPFSAPSADFAVVAGQAVGAGLQIKSENV